MLLEHDECAFVDGPSMFIRIGGELYELSKTSISGATAIDAGIDSRHESAPGPW
jgi:hypothetical protein